MFNINIIVGFLSLFLCSTTMTGMPNGKRSEFIHFLNPVLPNLSKYAYLPIGQFENK